MSGLFESEGLIINVIGGIKINAMENTSSVNYGEFALANFHSQNKENVIGQTFGDFDVVNQTPVGSVIYDPDGVDAPMSTIQNGLGLED